MDLSDSRFFFDHKVSHVSPVSIYEPVREGEAQKYTQETRDPVTAGEAFPKSVVERPRIG